MFRTFDRDLLSINALVPAIQVATLVAANKVLGKLNQFSVALQSATLIGSVSALVSALAQNVFSHPIVRYVSIPVGTAVGYAAHRFFYPALAVNPKILALTAAVLLAVRVCSSY
jgi:hypothetical protein